MYLRSLARNPRCSSTAEASGGAPVQPEVVVVTGASAGLGRAVAQAFARRGAHIGLIARGRERLEEVCREVERLGGRALVLAGDMADPATSEQAAAQTEETFGPIDIWVNNAMTTVLSPVSEMTASDYQRVTDVTYLGCVYGTLAALQRMRLHDRGTIVQVGSALAYRSIPLQSAYCAAKHALVGFSDSLRSELIHEGSRVHVTVVHMPAINTPQAEWSKSRMPRKAQPVPPIFQCEVCADAVYWSAHQRHREVFIGLSTVQAIWTQRLLPGVADHLAARLAWDSQMYDGPRDPNQPDNLYNPVWGHQGSHGPFDARARSSSWELELTKRASWLATAAARLGGLVVRSLPSGRGRPAGRLDRCVSSTDCHGESDMW